MMARSFERGATLVEVLVAFGLLVTLVGGLAHLLLAARQSAGLAHRMAAAVLAGQDRLERLRALAWTWDLSGTPHASSELAASPIDVLDHDVGGYADVVDAGGRPIDEEGAGEGAFRRRWAIIPLASEEPAALAIEVCVFDLAASGDGAPLSCLATVRTRQP
jgi:hypothetical protein